MKEINFSIVFNRKNKLDKDNSALIHIRANFDNKSIYFSSGVSIHKDFWSDKKREIKSSHPQYLTLNRSITEFRDNLIDLSRKIYDKQKYISLDLLQDYYNDKEKLNNSFIDFYQNELNKSTQESATITTHNTTLKELKTFKKQILFEDLNFELLTDFEKYLYKKGLHQNTIHKYFRHLKKYVNLAIKKDRLELNRNPFIKLKIDQVETHREYLNSADFLKIVQFTLPKEKKALQPVLDMFMFSLYTGLRFSDVAALPKDVINYNLKQGNYIDLQMIKTKNRVFIPIDDLFNALGVEVPESNKPLSILKRNIKAENEYIFDGTNQHVNRQLKEIGTLLNIKTNITFHTARHTIAMYLLNDCKLDILSIGKLLGHKKIETTQIYSKMSNEGLQSKLKIVANNRKPSQKQLENVM